MSLGQLQDQGITFNLNLSSFGDFSSKTFSSRYDSFDEITCQRFRFKYAKAFGGKKWKEERAWERVAIIHLRTLMVFFVI